MIFYIQNLAVRSCMGYKIQKIINIKIRIINMGFKKLPYSLKGGLITGIIFLIIYFILPQFLFFITPFTSLSILHLGLISILSNVISISESTLNLLLISAWVGLFLDFLIWILIGIFIGWIIGKIKSKKK